MTRTNNARLAGFTFLLYIAAGLSSMALMSQATQGESAAAKLASLAAHAPAVRGVLVLTLLTTLSAVVLGVTLHALTREQDRDLALLGLSCRLAEGFVGLAGAPATLALLRLASQFAAPGAAPDPASIALGAHLLRLGGGSYLFAATLFAIGSSCFAYLFVRGRTIPLWLAWLGLVASLLLVVALPVQLGGLLSGALTRAVWLPMLVFEVVLAFWLMVKGVAQPAASRPAVEARGGSAS